MDALEGNKEVWEVGEVACFEYHCLRCHSSGDAEAWYRDHQEVIIVRPLAGSEADGNALLNNGVPFHERADLGMPAMYKVRFPDGHGHDVFEDELYANTSFFSAELGPPSAEAIQKARSARVL